MKFNPTTLVRSGIILFAMLAGTLMNHASMRFGPAEICAVAEFIGEIPDYCNSNRFVLTAEPWENLVVNEYKENDPDSLELTRAKDVTVFIVDGILILLGALAIKQQKS